MNMITLNDGNKIPSIGFGVYMIPNDGPTYEATLKALQLGYRHIDTAAAYFNESDVGQAVRDSGIPREEIFITSKLWLQDHGYKSAQNGIERSLKKLNSDYIDLYLIHQPYGDVASTWRAMEEAKEQGKIHSIGVCNMTPSIWHQFEPEFTSKPVVNQVECNPFFQQKELREMITADNVKIEAWYPLGHGDITLLKNPVILRIAEKHSKSVGQIILRFETQEGFIVLPKSTNSHRMEENINIFDFDLTPEEMNEIRLLDKGQGAHNPDAQGMEEMLKNAYVIED